MKEIAVLMACYNRRDSTLKCLKSLFCQKDINVKFTLKVFLLEDGCTDGTGEAVTKLYQDVVLLEGDGNLFWNGGMSVAFREALKSEFDYYLWLNDDTSISTHAISRLLNTDEDLRLGGSLENIVVGAVCDPDTSQLTYGGYRRKPTLLRSLIFEMIPASDEVVPCEGICGNCVLISSAVAKMVGNLNERYQHRWGDIDYALRAVEMKCGVWVAPGFVGTCSSNPRCDQWRDTSLSIGERFRLLHDVRGLGRRDWLYFTKRHGGMFWVFDWVAPYVSILLSSFKGKVLGAR